MSRDSGSVKFTKHTYYPIIFFLPIYLLFSFFPNVVNIPLYEIPPSTFFPPFNNYWSLGNTGIESFILTLLSFIYILLNLYFTARRDSFLVKGNDIVRNYISLSFILIFSTIWIISNFAASAFYWQFQEYHFDNLKSWLFVFFYIFLFYLAIYKDNPKSSLYSYSVLIFFCSIY